MLDHIIANPVGLIGLLFACSLLPLFAVAGTAFLKISVVLALLRNAIGIQQIPPNMALYGLSLMLSMFVMAPVGSQVWDNVQRHTHANRNLSIEIIDEEILQPYRCFLIKFADPEQQAFFANTSTELVPQEYASPLDPQSFVVLIPSFALTQLIEGFKIGFLLYLPFIAIDLIVSIILLAMGMMMVSPMTIALPFKLLVFILMGGWQKLFAQLVLSYT